MINLSRYSFKSRLIAGFGLILFLNIGALYISFQKLNQVKQDLITMYNHSFEVTNALKDIKIAIVTDQSIIKDLILSDDIEELNTYFVVEEEYHKKVQLLFQLIESRYLGDLEDVKQFKKIHQEWEVSHDRVLALIKQGKKEAALQFMKTESANLVITMLDKKKVLIDFAEEKGNFLQSKYNDKSFSVFMVLLLSVVVISFVIAYVISMSISEPLKAMVIRINKNTENTETKLKASEQEILNNAVIRLEKTLKKTKAYNLELEKSREDIEHIHLEMSQQINLLNKSAIVSETDIKGNITFVNDQFCEVSGFSEEELLGKNHRILKSNLQPQGLFVGMWAAISMGRIWQGEICNKRRDGTFYWVMTTIAPFKNKKGKIEKYVSIRFEITSLKELELKLKNRAIELNSTNKKLSAAFKELEMFSYSVSHDLKAPLRALQGFSKNLHRKYGNQLDETANRWINFIETNAERMDNLITDILTFSRINRTEIKKESVNMNDLVDKMFNQEKIPYTQLIKFNVDKLPVVFGDISMMEMVWQNLIGNALKYSSKNEIIEIIITGHEDKTHCHYTIKDNGVGFDMQHYDKLFNIFQRLHDNDEFTGTGVGLANINRIIQKHGGEIWAESEIDKGALFEFTIPKT